MKVRCLISLLTVGSLVTSGQLLAFENRCQEEGDLILNSLIERWRWEAFWERGTSGFQYQPKTNATLDVFWNSDLAGLCSLDMGLCMAYERQGGRLRQSVASGKPLRGIDVSQTTDSFLRKLAKPRIIQEENKRGAQGKTGDSNHYDGERKAVAIPFPSSQVVVSQNATNFKTCLLKNERLPPLGLPKAIRDRIYPDNLYDFEGWLQRRLNVPPPGTKAEYLIPYYGPDDPMVYVLIKVNGAVESVIFTITKPDGTGWELAGHLDANESVGQVVRLEALIVSARMTSIVR